MSMPVYVAVAIHVQTVRCSEVVTERDQLCCGYEATYDDWACSNSSVVKKAPAMQETQHTQVPSLSQEDPLGGEMAIHSNIMAWEIPWTAESGGLLSKGLERAGYDRAHTHVRTGKFRAADRAEALPTDDRSSETPPPAQSAAHTW